MVTTPVFEHLFNIGQGLKSFDTSGNHRHSVLSGNPSWVAGRKGKAIALDGTDDAFVAPVPECDNDDFTVGFWVQNWLDAGATGAGILALQSSDYVHVAENCLVIYRAVGDSKIKVACYDSSHILQETLDSGVTASSGYMCVRRSGDVVSFFLNGAFVAEASVSDICAFTWLLVGHTSYGYAVADWIDKIRYWDSALSDEEIEYWYAKDKPRWNDSCVLWLRGDEENGDVVKDYSPHGNDGALTATLNDGAITGATWIVDAEKGKCLSFDGNDDYVTVSHNNSLNFAGDFTLSFYCDIEAISGDDVVSKVPSYLVRLASSANLTFFLWGRDNGSGLNYVNTSAGGYVGSGVSLVTIVVSGNNILFYKDGVYKETKTLTGTTDLGTGNLTFSVSGTTRSIKGKMFSVALWNRALDADEISSLDRYMNVSYGCVGKWLLNEGSGTTAYDSHNRFPSLRGNGLNCNGVNEYAVFPHQTVLALQQFTCFLKVRLGSLGKDRGVISKSASGNRNWELLTRQNNFFQFWIFDTSGTDYYVQNYVAADEWLHMIFGYDGDDIYITKNGVTYTKNIGFITVRDVATPSVNVGRLYDTSWLCDALFDDVIIFCRALSAVEKQRVTEADGFLDYIPLRIQDGSLVVSVDSVGVQWDSWANGACRRKHLGLGKNVSYTFTAIEEVTDVSWLDSAAYILKEKKDAGTPIDLYIKKTDVLAAESTSVVIDSMNVRYSPTMQVRYIDFSVREQ